MFGCLDIWVLDIDNANHVKVGIINIISLGYHGSYIIYHIDDYFLEFAKIKGPTF